MAWVEVYGGQRSLAFELTTALWLAQLGQLGQAKTIRTWVSTVLF